MKILILLAAVFAASAAEAQPARELQIQRPIAPEIARQPAVTATSDFVLKELLRGGYDIIHIDAPVGKANARFILRKGDKIYSCDPVMFREGGAEESIRILPTPCLDLTP